MKYYGPTITAFELALDADAIMHTGSPHPDRGILWGCGRKKVLPGGARAYVKLRAIRQIRTK